MTAVLLLLAAAALILGFLLGAGFRLGSAAARAAIPLVRIAVLLLRFVAGVSILPTASDRA